MRIESTLRRCSFVVALCVAGAVQAQPRDAEPATLAAQDAVRRALPFADQADFDDARAGFVATVPDAELPAAGGRPGATATSFAFLAADAPSTVNPSLWRQAQLNNIHGLFKVVDGLYQVRGFDISNMTLVEGDTGVIVIDPLLTLEAARAALNLYFQHRPRRPISAVIYSHNHVDHFGGARGVVSDDDVASRRTRIIAPQGFLDAIAEGVLTSNAAARRSQFQFGGQLVPGPRGRVDVGLGKSESTGTRSLVAPTELITRTMETRTIDGVEIVFQLTPGSEAPAEMNLYFPRLRVLDMAENATHTLHNLYAIRGSDVRDGRVWSRYISDALEAFGSRSDVLIAQHHWPTRGAERVQAFLKRQRDLYKFVHDQSVRLLNQGYTPNEIAQALHLPSTLAADWSARDHYGTLSHNSKAVYQRYLGWYDANPAHLDELPPVDAARKTLEYMGGAAAVLARAREDYRRGQYRWVASVLEQVVYAEPTNREARALAADALEQLGYQAEAGSWRNAYLQGAQELRNGVRKRPPSSALPVDTLNAIPLDAYFDFLGVRLNGTRADGKHIVINWLFSDTQQRYVLNLENAALTHVDGRQAADADASLALKRATWLAIAQRQTTFAEAIANGALQVSGDAHKLFELLNLLDDFDPTFEVVEPKPGPVD
ncbi:MAG TPA: alkyl sulfatase dimerization domain-containing protein [Burkholderiaceae bacterium]|nr:alkyl sulfatase dimerization domain-containing protein [Burkholderiaceae bacterium]